MFSASDVEREAWGAGADAFPEEAGGRGELGGHRHAPAEPKHRMAIMREGDSQTVCSYRKVSWQ
jgi:hypothetical protein